MKRRLFTVSLLLSAGPVLAFGCAGQSGSATVRPADFVGAEAPDPAPTAAEAVNPPAAEEPAPPAVTANASLQNSVSYSLDAMVGQVNGRAIYADTVLDPLDEQLAALGRQLPRPDFTQRARQLVSTTIDQIVTDALILGESERDLAEREHLGLQAMVKRKREELLRQHGQGSLSLTEHNLQEQTGRTLDQTLNDYRQQVIVSRYLREKLFPRINVTRRDVERYYKEHMAEFAPKSSRTLRLIRVSSDSDAQQIVAKLTTTPFPQVATDKLNLYRPEQGGVMEEMTGEAAFDSPELNEAIGRLRQGEWAGPVPFRSAQVFVYVEKLTEQEGLSLEDAQLKIDKLLREQQYRELSSRERQRMMKEGSYTALDQMTDALVQIAVARYAAP